VEQEHTSTGQSNDRSRTDRTEAIYRATAAIATELSLDSVLQRIVDAARELLNTRYAALGVVDEERRRLTRFVVSGVTDEQIEGIGHWPTGLGLLGELIHFPHPLRVKDISKDPRSIGLSPNHPPMTSFLGVPIIRGDRVLGNFYMTEKVSGQEFTDDDEEVLSLFATHAAIAIENARLYTETDTRLRAKIVEVERAEKRARFLSDLGALLLRLPPDSDLPLQEIAERATEPLTDVVAIYLVDPAYPSDPIANAVFHRIPERRDAALELLQRFWSALRDEVVLQRRSILTPPQGVETGKPVFDIDTLESARFSSAMGVPIATRQTVYGVLISLASRPLRLTEDDRLFALLIADRLGSALDGASLYQQQLEARSRVQELADLAQHRATELETLLDTMADAVYVADAELRLVRFNSSFAQLVGLSGPEHEGEPLRQFMDRLLPENDATGEQPPEDLPMARALRGESFTNHVLRIVAVGTGSERFLSVSGAPIRDGTGRIVAAVNVARDITEMKEIDRLKDEFISVASHEMKTPLTVIRGYSQILEKRLEAGGARPGELDMAKRILGQTARLTSLTDRLLDVSRIQFGRLGLDKRSIDLSALVTEITERMRVSTEYHSINASVEPSIQAEVDVTRLEEVLANLVINAAKYSPEGTKIDVALERTNGDALISVRDRGYGIPMERQGQIFQRFYRAMTDDGKPGLGLGLYVSKGIVEAHGGEIWFESEEGKGSTFYVRLPAE
jgi:two-component system, OmpR family, phosphate regulon sensor histidine kinase PhoR